MASLPHLIASLVLYVRVSATSSSSLRPRFVHTLGKSRRKISYMLAAGLQFANTWSLHMISPNSQTPRPLATFCLQLGLVGSVSLPKRNQWWRSFWYCIPLSCKVGLEVLIIWVQLPSTLRLFLFNYGICHRCITMKIHNLLPGEPPLEHQWTSQRIPSVCS